MTSLRINFTKANFIYMLAEFNEVAFSCFNCQILLFL